MRLAPYLCLAVLAGCASNTPKVEPAVATVGTAKGRTATMALAHIEPPPSL